MILKKLDRRKLKWFLIRRGRMVAKDVNECWLDTNLDKGYIDTERHFAGVKLRGIYERTIPKTIIGYTKDRIDSGGSWVDNNIGRLNALDKLKIITKELGMSDYQLTILHCGDNYSYGEIGKKLRLTRQTVARRMKINLKNLFYIFNSGLVR
mgnify:CR=1 FL=1